MNLIGLLALGLVVLVVVIVIIYILTSRRSSLTSTIKSPPPTVLKQPLVPPTVPKQAPPRPPPPTVLKRPPRPPTPIVPLPLPIVQPPTPVVQPPTPIVQPPTPIVQPPTPIGPQPLPIVQPPTPVVQPPTPIGPQPLPIVQPPTYHFELMRGSLSEPYFALRIGDFYYTPNNPEGWLKTSTPSQPYTKGWTVESNLTIPTTQQKDEVISFRNGQIYRANEAIKSIPFFDRGYSNQTYTLTIQPGAVDLLVAQKPPNLLAETDFHLSISPGTSYHSQKSQAICQLVLGQEQYSLNHERGWIITTDNRSRVVDMILSRNGKLGYRNGQLYLNGVAVTSVSYPTNNGDYSWTIQPGACK